MGANGVGKTNLLEAVHVATQGFSPRTRTDSQVVRLTTIRDSLDAKNKLVSDEVKSVIEKAGRHARTSPSG